MEVHNNVAITNNQNSVAPWVQLQRLYNETKVLMEDMENNPQNALKDLDQLTDIAKQMESISSGIKPPVSDPYFHTDCSNFVSYLEGMKYSILGGIAHDKQTLQDEQDALRDCP